MNISRLKLKIYQKLRPVYHKLLFLYYTYIKREVSCELIILDDIFPQHISAFRILEYSCYLDCFKTIALSTATSFPALKEYRSFNEVRDQFYQEHKQYRGRIFKYLPFFKVKAQFAYFVFLQNGVAFLDFIEKRKIPFGFTLYPGGGFTLGQESTNISLARIFSSPYFRYVIVTQKHVLDYLKVNNFCDESKIKFIYGSPGNTNQEPELVRNKKYFPSQKEYLDICFVAGKYMPQGKDKGYDTFIEVAKRLNRVNKNIKFHVVGGFDESDIDVSELEGSVKFYGYLQTKELHKFYRKMDIILSPNLSNVIFKGAFDGFPLGCVQEAGGCHVLMLCYDDLNQNLCFESGKDIIILDPDINSIVQKILSLYDDPDKIYEIAMNGAEKIFDIISFNNQLTPRIDLIKSFLQ